MLGVHNGLQATKSVPAFSEHGDPCKDWRFFVRLEHAFSRLKPDRYAHERITE